MADEHSAKEDFWIRVDCKLNKSIMLYGGGVGENNTKPGYVNSAYMQYI